MNSTPSTPPHANRRLWHQLLSTQLMCAGVTLVFVLMGATFWIALVYSLLIGNFISGFIHAGRYLVWRSMVTGRAPADRATALGWIGWPRMAGVLLVAVALGYLLGAALADALTGQHTAMPWSDAWRVWLAIFLLSLIPALLGTLMVRSRNRLAHAEADAANAARQVAETQLKLLESQLEPHMLFNTLANLRALIGVDPARAQTMLDRMIDYLRATLNASRSSSHTLSAEFTRLEDYLALMQIRMGERLRVQVDLPAGLADLPVPPLLLQPLVENAIKHGLEPLRRGGLLTVLARREGTSLLLQVSDSGTGLDGATDTLTSTPPGTGFGLTQVRERLRTLHGERASLCLIPGPGGGTVAEVRLPWPAPPDTTNTSHDTGP